MVLFEVDVSLRQGETKPRLYDAITMEEFTSR